MSSLLFSFSCFARSASEGVCARGTERTIREHNFLIFLFARGFASGRERDLNEVVYLHENEGKNQHERERISTETADRTKSCECVSLKYLCFLIPLFHFIFCQTCIKIHFYCVDLLFLFLS